MAKRKKARRRLERQLKKVVKMQKKLLAAVKPAGPLAGAGAGALLGAAAMVAQRLGLGDRLEHALAELRDRWLPAGKRDEVGRSPSA